MFDEHVFLFVPPRIGISYKSRKSPPHDSEGLVIFNLLRRILVSLFFQASVPDSALPSSFGGPSLLR